MFTAYKRISIEKDRMFRQGGLLAQDATQGAGSAYLAKNPDKSRADNLANDICYHVGIFDTTNTFGAGSETFYVKYNSESDYIATFDIFSDAICTVPYTVQISSGYDASEPDGVSHEWLFTSGKSAGIGVFTAWPAPRSDFYEAILDGPQLHEVFTKDAFVSIFNTFDSASSMPYLPPFYFSGFELAFNTTCQDRNIVPMGLYDFNRRYRFAYLWFKHRTVPNYIWVGGAATTDTLQDANGTCTACQSPLLNMPQYIGLTAAYNTASFIHIGGIEAYCQPDNRNAIVETTNHELAHKFYVNSSNATGHCTHCQWTAEGWLSCGVPAAVCTDPDEACLMNPDDEIWTHKHRLNRFDLLCGDPGCPTGAAGCCTSCALPGNGSIRQLYNPIQGVQP